MSDVVGSFKLLAQLIGQNKADVCFHVTSVTGGYDETASKVKATRVCVCVCVYYICLLRGRHAHVRTCAWRPAGLPVLRGLCA